MVKSGMKQLAATSGDRGDLGAPHFELGSWVNKKHLDELNMPIYGMDMGWIMAIWVGFLVNGFLDLWDGIDGIWLGLIMINHD